MIESKVQMLEFLESNINMPSHTIGFLIPHNQSSLEGKMNDPIFYIKVTGVTRNQREGRKKGGKHMKK